VEELEQDGQHHQISRRRVLVGGAAVASAAVWAPPVIESLVAKAAASSAPPGLSNCISSISWVGIVVTYDGVNYLLKAEPSGSSLTFAAENNNNAYPCYPDGVVGGAFCPPVSWPPGGPSSYPKNYPGPTVTGTITNGSSCSTPGSFTLSLPNGVTLDSWEVHGGIVNCTTGKPDRAGCINGTATSTTLCAAKC